MGKAEYGVPFAVLGRLLFVCIIVMYVLVQYIQYVQYGMVMYILTSYLLNIISNSMAEKEIFRIY